MVQRKYPDDAYICSGYRRLTDDCTMHYVSTKNIEKLLLTSIQRISYYVKENEQEFIQKVHEASAIQQEENIKIAQRELKQSEKRFAELDVLVKQLYEQNVSGKLSDRHYERLLADYDNEQSTLETKITESQSQISSWDERKLKTDSFIELANRYTDFTELTTSMVNEFIEKVIIHEGIGRGKERTQQVDIHLNFIGTFRLPDDFITPLEIEEQQRLRHEAEEKARLAKERSMERYKAKNEIVKQKNREFTVRKKAGLLTPEEIAAEEIRLEKRREYQKKWREEKMSGLPPKPPKPKILSVAEIGKRRKEGLPITDEELERYTAWRKNKNATHNAWYHRRRAEIIANAPPKERKPTKKERMKDISSRLKSGLSITPQEQEAYAAYRAERNEKHRIWRDSKARSESGELVIYDIQKRMRDGVVLTKEEATFHEAWRAKKNEYRRELYQRQKAKAVI